MAIDLFQKIKLQNRLSNQNISNQYLAQMDNISNPTAYTYYNR